MNKNYAVLATKEQQDRAYEAGEIVFQIHRMNRHLALYRHRKHPHQKQEAEKARKAAAVQIVILLNNLRTMEFP